MPKYIKERGRTGADARFSFSDTRTCPAPVTEDRLARRAPVALKHARVVRLPPAAHHCRRACLLRGKTAASSVPLKMLLGPSQLRDFGVQFLPVGISQLPGIEKLNVELQG